MSGVTFEEFARIVDIRPHANQRQVVTSSLGPQRVAAGAGTGKTTSMALRVAWLVASGAVEPNAVLGLTFTTKAAASMHATMRAALRRWHETWEGEATEELAEPTVMTYNAFAARIIAEHGLRLGYEPNPTVLINGARHRLAYDVVCRSAEPALASIGRNPAAVTVDLLGLDDSLTDLCVTPERLIAFEEQQIAWLSSLENQQSLVRNMLATSVERRALAQIVQSFRSAKKSRDVLDFADQTRLAGDLVREYPEIARQWRDAASIVLLDEYQDTSIAQRRLLQEIFGPGHPITAVGDASQAIYGWRGASVANMIEFARHFEAEGEPQTLNVSYRSGPAILDVANAISRGIPDRSGDLEPGNPERGTGQVTCGLFTTRDEEHAWIVDRIDAMGARGVPWSDIAVLATTGAELAAMRRALDARGIPTQLHGAAGLLSEPAVVDVHAMLQVIADPTANGSLVRLLAGPRWRIGPRDLAALGHRAADLVGRTHRGRTSTVTASLDDAVAGSDPAEALCLLEAVFDPGDPSCFSPECWVRLAEFADLIRQLARHGGDPVPEVIGRILELSGLGVEVLIAEQGERDRLALAGLMDLAADFSRLDDGASVGAFLARLADAERFDVDLPVDEGPRRQAVQLMTIHKAKGLEFPHVFVPSMSTGVFPSAQGRASWTTDAGEVPMALREDIGTADGVPAFPDPVIGPREADHRKYKDWLKQRELLESRRLAYVALTRAKQSLAVTGHWWGPTQRKVRGPAPFLDEVREVVLGFPESWGSIITWAPAPEDDDVNPAGIEESGVTFRWPAELPAQERIREAASLVLSHLAGPDVAAPAGDLTAEQADVLARWDADLEFLVAEAREQRSTARTVRLPDSVSASTFMRAQRDPEALAADLARPMPRSPSPAARRGTAIHAWVERRFGQTTLIDLDDLPGAADADRLDLSLAELQSAFERSSYASSVPVATEFPFGIVVGGRLIRGRIDAVFPVDGHGDANASADPHSDDVIYEVVDWKTGSGRGIDPLQLAIYRRAWARHVGIPESQVGAAFLLVETGEVIRPVSLPDLS